MPVQYFYPISDYIPTFPNPPTTGFTGRPNDYPNLYTNIDEGVVIPIDADYILGSGFPTNGTNRIYNTVFDFSSLAITPSLVSLNIRYSGGITQSETETFSTTSVINAIDINNNNSNTYTLPSSNIFNNNFQDITTFYNASVTPQTSLFVKVLDYVNYKPSGSISYVLDLVPKFAISAMELMFSGVSKINNSCSLYIKGSMPTGNSLPLYVCNLINSGVDLYLESSKYNTKLDLFLKALDGVPLSGNTNLFVKQDNAILASGINTTSLFTFNSSNISGSMNLFIAAPLSGAPNAGMTLFLQGQTPTSIDSFSGSGGGINSLFIANNFGSGNLSTNLIVANVSLSSGNMPLYINNQQTGSGNTNTTLFVAQKDNVSYSSGNTNLYINGGNSFLNTNVNLFISGTTNATLNNATNLFTYAVTNAIVTDNGILLTDNVNQFLINPNDSLLLYPNGSASSPNIYGIYNTTPLFLQSDNLNTNVPLYLNGNGNTYSSGYMNLYLKSSNHVNNSAPLFISNSGLTLNSGTNLYINGTGLNDGWNIMNGQTSLFIARDNYGTLGNVSLFTKVASSINSGNPLYLFGGTYLNNSTNLVMPSTKGIPSGAISSYIHGY